MDGRELETGGERERERGYGEMSEGGSERIGGLRDGWWNGSREGGWEG